MLEQEEVTASVVVTMATREIPVLNAKMVITMLETLRAKVSSSKRLSISSFLYKPVAFIFAF